MDQDADSPPTFWFHPPIPIAPRRRPPINPVLLILLLPILASLFLFFISPLLSHISDTLKLTSLNSTWNSINISIVLFAILCGVFARKNDGSSPSEAINQVDSHVPESYDTVRSLWSVPWIELPDRALQVSGGLRRSGSSYPELRGEESLWGYEENRSQFSDDFGVDVNSSSASSHSRWKEGGRENLYRPASVSCDIRHRPWPDEADEEYSPVQEIREGTIEVGPDVPESLAQPQSPEGVRPPSPPLPPPPASGNLRQRRNTRSRRKQKVQATSPIEADELYKELPPPPPSPPPPPAAASETRMHRSDVKHETLDAKVGDASIRSVLSPTDIQPPPPPPPPSMLHNMFNKERKHKRIHSIPATAPPSVPPPPPRSIFNNLFKSGGKSKLLQSSDNAPPPPTPPPRPPPSSIINSLFKTRTRSKLLNSSSTASPPPPPPPPPRSTVPVTLKRESKRKGRTQPPSPPSQPISESLNRLPASTDNPPLPTKASSYDGVDDFLPSGSQSTPPPPPPFKKPAMKFEHRGDFVRLGSTHGSVSSSPDREFVDLRLTTMDGEDSIWPGPGLSPISFSSPDVNAKAEDFISRLKDEWRMEKLNSIKRKVGPTSSPSPKQTYF